MAGQKNGHGGRFCVCLRRVTDLFHPAAKMDQLTVITPAEAIQWQDLEKTFTKLRVLDLDINIDRGGAFNLFIKKFQSVSLLEEYLALITLCDGPIKRGENRRTGFASSYRRIERKNESG